MRTNKGFSLIEIILVIAIMAIFAGGTIASMSYISNGNTKKCVKAIDNTLGQLRLNNMSKEKKSYLYLYQTGSRYYLMVSDNNLLTTMAGGGLDTGGSEIGGSGITISYRKKGEAADTALTEGQFLLISFKRSSGAFESNPADPLLPQYYERITVEGSSDQVIHMVEETGKHYIQ